MLLPWRALGAVIAVSLLSLRLSTCRSPGEGGRGPGSGAESTELVDLPGIETKDLTAREKREWSSAVSELLAPCPDQPVSLAQCVKESRACRACSPAAKFLVRQVQKGRTRSQLDAAFKERFGKDQVKSISTDGSPAKGPANAPVQIVEWADFECPFCGRTAPVLEELLERYPDSVRLVFKNYPLSSHKYSEKAARAAVAAGRQGKFWEMHKALFGLQPKPPELPIIRELAKGLGLDMKKFNEDLESEAVADAVAKDRKQADALGLEGTPLIYINGRLFDLDHFEIGEDLEQWVKLEIELKTGKKAVAKKAVPKKPAAPPASASAAPVASGAPVASAEPAKAPAPKAAPKSAASSQ